MDILDRSVGFKLTNREDDVKTVERLLDRSGYPSFEPDTGPTGMSGAVLEGSIKDFQRDHGLKQDGMVYTDGPTINRLAQNFQVPMPDKRGEFGGQKSAPAAFPKNNNAADIGEMAKPHRQVEESDNRRARDEAFWRMRGRTGKQEGGFADRSKLVDKGGPTQKGISQTTYDKFRDKYPHYQAYPRQTRDLSDDQINTIYRERYYQQPQLDKLVTLPGLSKDADDLIDHVFDGGVMSGLDDAGAWLQQALDEVSGSNLKVKGRYEGIIGTQTRTAFERAMQKGLAARVNTRFSDLRRKYLDMLSNAPDNKGWLPRVKSFRPKR